MTGYRHDEGRSNSAPRSRFARYAGPLIATLLAGIAPATARDVTFERLVAADKEPNNWLMIHGDYAASQYSSLAQINRTNAKNLKLAFTVGLGGGEQGPGFPNAAMEASPLVEDGFMYLTDGWSSVYKLDVRAGTNGHILWKTDPGVDKARVILPVNRGVALYRDLVIELTGDGRIVAMKKSDGYIVYDVSIRSSPVEAFTAAPLVVKDKLLVGVSGGDFGARGWLIAFDLEKRKIAWRWSPIPGPDDPGSKSWPDPATAWQRGGGAIWSTGAYDPKTNRLYWGTANPNKANDSVDRGGDNLYTDSSVALDADTGKLIWYYQYLPNDPFDYDEVGSQMLIDTEIGGKRRQILSHFARNGFYYALDAADGHFIAGSQYLQRVTWTRGLDPKTGKPLEYDPSKRVQTYAIQPERQKPPVLVCPEQRGGVSFWPPTYSPLTKLTYGTTWEGCHTITVAPTKMMGGTIEDHERITGAVTAVDPATAKRVLRHASNDPDSAGATATAGHIVVTAFEYGRVEVLDDRTLKPLYTFDVGTLMAAPPVVYAVGGKEYIAILAGGRLPPVLAGPNANPETYSVQSVPMLLVFSL